MNKFIQQLKPFLKGFTTDKYLLILYSSMLLLAILLSLHVALLIHPNDLQLVSRYTAFGGTHFYRDQWFYQIIFPIFIMTVAFLHILVSKKVLDLVNRNLALFFAWLGIGIIFFAWITVNTILTVWSPL